MCTSIFFVFVRLRMHACARMFCFWRHRFHDCDSRYVTMALMVSSGVGVFSLVGRCFFRFGLVSPPGVVLIRFSFFSRFLVCVFRGFLFCCEIFVQDAAAYRVGFRATPLCQRLKRACAVCPPSGRSVLNLGPRVGSSRRLGLKTRYLLCRKRKCYSRGFRGVYGVISAFPPITNFQQ